MTATGTAEAPGSGRPTPATASLDATPASRPQTRREMWWAMGLAGGAALAVTAPRFAGLSPAADPGFYARNAGVVVLAFVAAYLLWRRGLHARPIIAVGAVFAVAALVANVYPFQDGGTTELLVAWHLPLALWVAIGIAHADTLRPTHLQWMAYLRLSGEWVTYVALFAAGGWAVHSLTVAAFAHADFATAAMIDGWIVPAAAASAAVVATWLVDAGHGRVDELAPILSRALIGLLTVVMLAYVGTMVVALDRLTVQGQALAVVTILLVGTLGAVVHAIASRRGTEKVQVIDRVQFALVITAWGLAGLVVAATLARLVAEGASAAVVAGLLASLVVFANFSWSSWVGHVMLHNNCLFERLDRFQTRFIPVYAVWSAIVVIALPPVFGFA